MTCTICLKDMPHSHSTLHWIGVDFDGTLAYTIKNRTDPYQVGEPIPEMINRIKDWVLKGFTVKLLTARMNKLSSTGHEDWCNKHLGFKLECTNAKDGWMEVLWDDRAIQVLPDTGMPIGR